MPAWGQPLSHRDPPLGISQKILFVPLTPQNDGGVELLISCLSGRCPHPVPVFWDGG